MLLLLSKEYIIVKLNLVYKRFNSKSNRVLTLLKYI